MATKMRITGAAEIAALLKQMPDRVSQRVVENALRAGARVIAAEARENVPVDTGELRDSITVAVSKWEGRRRKRDEGVVFVGFKSPASRRAHLTEFGTVNQPAQPFMRPALDAKGAEAVERIGKIMGNGVEREAARLAANHYDHRGRRRRR